MSVLLPESITLCTDIKITAEQVWEKAELSRNRLWGFFDRGEPKSWPKIPVPKLYSSHCGGKHLETCAGPVHRLSSACVGCPHPCIRRREEG